LKGNMQHARTIGPEDDDNPETSGLLPDVDPSDDEFVTDPVDEGDGNCDS